ncbi:MAG TPA: hypothetical protein VIL55_16690 [Naasia sp.]
MTAFVEDLIFEGSPLRWVPILGLVDEDVDPLPPDNTADAARNALPDDGSYIVLPGVNSGLMPSTDEADLIVVSGSQTFSDQSSTLKVITGRKFTGNVTITGKNYLFKNCLFNGPGGVSALVVAWAVTVQNLVLEDCEIRMTVTGTKTARGFQGWNATLRRVWIHDVEDGFMPFRLDMNDASNLDKALDLALRMYGSHVDDLVMYSPDSQVGGTQRDHQTHNDAMQANGGTNVVLRGNTILGRHNMALGDALVPNNPPGSSGASHISGNLFYPADNAYSAFMFSSGTQAKKFGSWTIDRNRVGSGAVVFNLAGAQMAPGGLIQITNNVVIEEPYHAGAFVKRPLAIDGQLLVSGNTRPDGSAFNTKVT